jgi:hypothetical protein
MMNSSIQLSTDVLTSVGQRYPRCHCHAVELSTNINGSITLILRTVITVIGGQNDNLPSPVILNYGMV